MDKKPGINSDGGLGAALDQLRADIGSPPDAPRGRQLPLIPSAGAAEPDPGLEPAKRGPGRPEGATNESTREWREWILSRYPSPLQFMAEICARPTLALAQELGQRGPCSALDALKVQLRAAETLARYMHSPMPVAVEVEAKGQVPIIFNISPQLGELVAAAGGELGNRGPFKVIDQKAGTSMTYTPLPDHVGQDDVGQDDANS